MTENVKITEDWPSAEAPEGFQCQLRLRGATHQELLALADWLEARGWFEEAFAIRDVH